MANVLIKNDEMLVAVVANDMKKIIEELSLYVLNQVRMSVIENVYNAYQPEYPNRHEMNGGFLGSWEKEGADTIRNIITSKIYSNPNAMILDEENYIHGSESGGDRRAGMPEYIQEGTGYDFDFNMPRDYWTPIAEMVKSGELDNILESAFTKFGIRYIKGL
jgi:hypothetical protein